MFSELLLATGLVVFTTFLHSIGLLGLSKAVSLVGFKAGSIEQPLPVARIEVSVVLVLGLMAIHGAEIWVYAITFLGIDAVDNLRSAVYFSTISYAAIGYSDADIRPEWALVAAIEGINGLIMLGWSTAFLVTVMARARR
ncbi:two pore domain potassium channel family protein [Luteibacter pinisoli]|uniref:Two pore domain potassium channel family protein n=1 Tax=Luteibacter pinisoli TaxID=2589080 RepID=A0A4Y5Z182_9GAMM|nr:ion channel [Luteibacter pinisoli]QDE38425.1 two pore domain potassium channel family protein [Luteibacter pinisoli]